MFPQNSFLLYDNKDKKIKYLINEPTIVVFEIESDNDFIQELQLTLNFEPAKLDKKNLIKTMSLNLEKNLLNFEDFDNFETEKLKLISSQKDFDPNMSFQTEFEIYSLREENVILSNNYNELLKKMNATKEEKLGFEKKSCPLKKNCDGKGNHQSGGDRHFCIESCPFYNSLLDLKYSQNKNEEIDLSGLKKEILGLKNLKSVNEQEILSLKNRLMFESNELKEPKQELIDLKHKFERLNSENNKNSSALKKYETNLNSALFEKNQLKISTERLSNQKDDLIKSLSDQLCQYKDKLNEPMSQNEKLRTEYDRLFSEYTICSERLSENDDKIKILESKLQEFRNNDSKQELSLMRNQFISLNTEFTHISEKLKISEAQISSLLVQNEFLQNHYNSAFEQLNYKDEQIKKLSDKHFNDSINFESNFKAKLDEIETLKKSYNQILNEIKLLKENFDQFRTHCCKRAELTNLKQDFDLEYDRLYNHGITEMKIRDDKIETLQRTDNIDLVNIPKVSRSEQNVWTKISKEYHEKTSGVSIKSINTDALLFYHWFDRDTNQFREIVQSKLTKPISEACKKKFKISDKKTLNSISIRFDYLEFKNFKISNSTRTKLLVDFEESLNEKLQNSGFNCYFKCIYNWFKKKSSKDNTPIWSGFYRCTEPTCSSYIKPFLRKHAEDNVYFDVFYSQNSGHELIIKQLKIKGNEREKLAFRLKAEGVSSFSDMDIIVSSLRKKEPIKKNTLYKIKNEFDHRFRISRDLIFDLKAIKLGCQFLGLSTNPNFSGFIHSLGIDPYGFLLMSDMQIKIWDKVKKHSPVWHLDATGGIHIDIDSQKKPFFYSMVFHDRKNKIILPIGEFISTDNTMRSISKFLRNIYEILKENNKGTESSIAPIIVTDFSWALMNSVLNVFNNMDMNEYLEWCFKKIFGESDNEERCAVGTRLYLCSTHFLKSLVRKVKKFNLELKFKNLFIFCFALLQNSVSIQYFLNILINVHNVYLNPLKTKSVVYSLEILRKEIRNKDLIYLNLNEIYSGETLKEEDVDFFSSRLKETETLESIAEKSPFNIFFRKKFEKWQEKINSENETFQKNDFYEPKLFNLLKKQLYILPLWTGIILNLLSGEFFEQDSFLKTRLTNNPVENYFGNLKNNILQKKKSYPSEIATHILMRIKAKYLQFYFDENSKTVRPKKNELSMQTEKWSKNGYKNKNNQQLGYSHVDFAKEKGFYYKEFDVGKLIYNDLFEYDPILSKIEAPELIEIDKFLTLNSKISEPMDTTETNDSEQVLDLCELSYTFEVISDKRWTFSSIKDYIEKSRLELIKLTNYLRKINSLAIFTDQKCEEKEQFLIILERFGLNKHEVVKCRSDGNCFYNSISTCLFGHEKNFYLIKLGVIFIMLEYEDLFREIVIKHHYEETYENIVCKTSRPNEWAMMLNILSTAILLNREISSLNLNHENFQIYKQKYLLNCSKKEPIKVAFF
ncbi:unnamed protein product [Brachionus calyciflorus]|uniref:OTU domain-containing protein n=1 Tax=Brachionus calyciflorus TaxID=104777 RepID=A0A813YRW3_9BILA|nr:unnamed protein product [Brachionus calyciflorus]